MTGYEELLAQLEAAEAALRERHGERITRITVSPTLTSWLKRMFPPAEAPLIATPWVWLSSIPIVEDASFVNGRLRIHRSDATEDWIAVPPDDPKWLVKIEEPVFDFPWSPA